MSSGSGHDPVVAPSFAQSNIGSIDFPMPKKTHARPSRKQKPLDRQERISRTEREKDGAPSLFMGKAWSALDDFDGLVGTP